MLREALKSMGRADLIGNGKKHLIPFWQPEPGSYLAHRRKNRNKQPAEGALLTQHTGLPPRAGTKAGAGTKARAGTKAGKAVTKSTTQSNRAKNKQSGQGKKTAASSRSRRQPG